MHTLAVIGAGQLGSRHLQALCALPKPCRIHVVDPSSSALEESRARVAQTGRTLENKEIAYHTSIHALPEHLDYAVIATTSQVRLTAMQNLLEARRVGALVLEKVLFSSIAHYADASLLLQRHAVPTWVNCARREYAPYQAIKHRLANQSIVDFSVTGGLWGLGCNGIHFIDLLAFLSDSNNIESISTDGLDSGHIPSKRHGYIEFTGALRGKIGNGAHFLLTSRPNSTRHLIQIRAESTSILIDEVGKSMYFLDENDPTLFSSEKMSIPHISELMTDVVSGILETGQCNLPTFNESSCLHQPFISALATHMGQPNDSRAVCMIT